MKKLSLYLFIIFSLVAFNTLWAAEAEPETDSAFPQQIIEVQAETCPVMGGKVNKSVNTIIDGKLYYFCCPGCIGSFRKNQQKYSGKLENAETKTLEVTNKDGKCPISGKKAKLKFFKIDQENKTITFYHDKSSLHQAQK
jgi:YHS domain-containing protein